MDENFYWKIQIISILGMFIYRYCLAKHVHVGARMYLATYLYNLDVMDSHSVKRLYFLTLGMFNTPILAYTYLPLLNEWPIFLIEYIVIAVL